METIEFKDYPDKTTPISATNLNQVQENVKSALNSEIFDLIYPVGSIYMSMSDAEPSTLFGGTWEAIKGRFLWGYGEPDDNTNTYWGTDLTYDGTHKCLEDAGSTGGETRHTVTIDEMPSHTHKLSGWAHIDNGTTKYGHSTTELSHNFSNQDTGMSYVGGGQPHNNIPPYVIVYMWKRTA